MGMYTELCIGVEFKKDTPKEVIAAIDSMVKGEGEAPNLAHSLFNTDRWSWMLISAGSAYFDSTPHLAWEEKYGGSRFLTVWTNIKNYTQEWQHFLSFIAPHIKTRGFIGHLRYEEAEHPTLLYADNGEIKERNL